MNKWSRNEKIGLAGVIIAILMIAVTLLIPELRHFFGLKSHHGSTVEETKPVPKSQMTTPPTKPKKQLSPSVPKEPEKQAAKPEERNNVQEPKLSPSILKETAKHGTKPEEPGKVQEPKPMVSRGNIKISCYVDPPYISPNETAMIKVFTERSNRSSVFDRVSYADIFITCPEGTFPSTGTNTLVGKTDQMGYFETLWNPQKDLKGKFSLGVEVKKEGVGTGVGTCRGEIR